NYCVSALTCGGLSLLTILPRTVIVSVLSTSSHKFPGVTIVSMAEYSGVKSTKLVLKGMKDKSKKKHKSNKRKRDESNEDTLDIVGE
ncbi:hypothetical protein GDO78_018565, partial [Eleutherodactylus coqui]